MPELTVRDQVAQVGHSDSSPERPLGDMGRKTEEAQGLRDRKGRGALVCRGGLGLRVSVFCHCGRRSERIDFKDETVIVVHSQQSLGPAVRHNIVTGSCSPHVARKQRVAGRVYSPKHPPRTTSP